ncbi:hypothetical protein MPH_12684 [Macrophomina phaseolina MS6]|uniref:Uncharacterized protein n=2 Tax=Macrophomina phaseolina TaxID=35725 RepID=K2RJD1_MACPH|nr:hypothetical protein MPH_12684 [Macrophomina phaseolina MS6]KAH7053193.1 hypothetical protein B0J12DRAFT_739312 [Macrophomina phaseolina]
MSTPSTNPTTTTAPFGNPTGPAYNSDSDSDGQARGGRRALVNSKDGKAPQQQQPGSHLPPPPSSANLAQPAGSLLKGATDENGNQKSAALLVGIKLDLEAEIHLTARVRGDICIGLY